MTDCYLLSCFQVLIDISHWGMTTELWKFFSSEFLVTLLLIDHSLVKKSLAAFGQDNNKGRLLSPCFHIPIAMPNKIFF